MNFEINHFKVCNQSDNFLEILKIFLIVFNFKFSSFRKCAKFIQICLLDYFYYSNEDNRVLFHLNKFGLLIKKGL